MELEPFYSFETAVDTERLGGAPADRGVSPSLTSPKGGVAFGRGYTSRILAAFPQSTREVNWSASAADQPNESRGWPRHQELKG